MVLSKNMIFSLLLVSLMFFGPVTVNSQQEATRPGPPPISQSLVREGDFAIKLAKTLNIGEYGDEVEAESALGGLGISPRNGWIADYPVTPDILGELRSSIIAAADLGKIDYGRDEAVRRFEAIKSEVQIGIRPHSIGNSPIASPDEAVKYPNPAVINNYYISEGPPVVTYYAPPREYYYLYGWVPYPFWWAGFWFPGYFILNDFHRPHYYGNRAVFISNHFNHISAHRVFRIDPVERYRGRTYAGIGVTNRKAFLSTGIPRSEQRVFNPNRSRRGEYGQGADMPVRKAPAESDRIQRRVEGSESVDRKSYRIERNSGSGGGRSGSGGRDRFEGGRR
jgi:hypothetical protein